MPTEKFKVGEPFKITMAIVSALIMSIGTYSFTRVETLESRVIWIADNYVKREELQRIDNSINGLRTDMKDMLISLKEEIRYERQRKQQSQAN